MLTRSPDVELGMLRTLVVAVLVLVLPVALITTTIRVAVSEQAVYDFSVRQHNASSVSGIPESELIRANGEIRDYLVNSNPSPLAIEVQDAAGDAATLFNARETAHMADVRDLVHLMFAVQVGSVALLLSLIVVMAVLWPTRVLAAGLLYGSMLTGAVIGAVGIIAMSGFESAWSQFHGIFFTNDLWQLDPDTDHLIQMFPEQFWFEVTSVLGGLIVLQAGLLAAASSVYLFLTRARDRDSGVQSRPESRPDPLRPELPGRVGHARGIITSDPRHLVR